MSTFVLWKRRCRCAGRYVPLCVWCEGMETWNYSTSMVSCEYWPVLGRPHVLTCSPVILLHVEVSESLLIEFSPTLLSSFHFCPALLKAYEIYWLPCLGINDLWRFKKELSSQGLTKPQGLWWALNSSSAVSADSRAQKGKKNKLNRAWVCWEHCWESWEDQGGLGSKANGDRGTDRTGVEPLGTGPFSQSSLATATSPALEMTKL